MQSSAIKWNPWNKVVQDHRDGTIDEIATNIIRSKLGLPVPWKPSLAELECRLPPIYDVFPQSGIISGLYRNNKKGRIYRVFDECVNATNAQDGQVMIVYRDVHDPDKPFVREHREFQLKFTISEEDQ